MNSQILSTAYCVRCKESRGFFGVVKTSESGRRMLMGKCDICGTNVNRVIDKEWLTEVEDLWDE